LAALAALAVAREAALPVLPPLQAVVARASLRVLRQLPVLVDLACRLALADLLFLAPRQVRADLALLARVPAEEVPVAVRHRSRSAAMAGR